MLQINVDEPHFCRLEAAGLGLVGFGHPADAVALQAAVDGAARQLGVDAAAHGLGDVVERQSEQLAQLDDQRLLQRRQAGGQVVRLVRAVLGGGAAAPAIDGL
jgi:hypothetical protein